MRGMARVNGAADAVAGRALGEATGCTWRPWIRPRTPQHGSR